MFIANTTGTLLGGTGVNRFADEVDIDAIKAEGIVASILEGPMARANRPADGRTDQVRTYTLRVHAGVDLRKYNRFRDDRTGDVYTFDSVTTPTATVGHRPQSARMRRTT